MSETQLILAVGVGIGYIVGIVACIKILRDARQEGEKDGA